MRINNNIMAMDANRQYANVQVSASKSMEKLSSGVKINRAADDAAGLSISEKMRGQIRGLQQASRNAQDGVSFVQTAEGAMNEVSNMLVRMKELKIQASNGSYGTVDTTNINAEMDALGTEIGRIVNDTKFNGIDVFGGISIAVDTAATIVVNAKTFSSTISSSSTIDDISQAIIEASADRANFGAAQNRLESAVKNIDNNAENLQSSESRIRDTDMASAMMDYTRSNVLSQAATAMLAQANQAPQSIQQILRQ